MPEEGKIVIVDGYNAMFKMARLGHNQHSYRFNIERKYFLAFLRAHTQQEKQYIIVFDGTGNTQIEREGNLWVIFSGDSQSADDIIVQLVSQGTVVRDKIYEIQVVTDDKELRERIRNVSQGIKIQGVRSFN